MNENLQTHPHAHSHLRPICLSPQIQDSGLWKEAGQFMWVLGEHTQSAQKKALEDLNSELLLTAALQLSLKLYHAKKCYVRT